MFRHGVQSWTVISSEGCRFNVVGFVWVRCRVLFNTLIESLMRNIYYIMNATPLGCMVDELCTSKGIDLRKNVLE